MDRKIPMEKIWFGQNKKKRKRNPGNQAGRQVNYLI